MEKPAPLPLKEDCEIDIVRLFEIKLLIINIDYKPKANIKTELGKDSERKTTT